ncbi:cobaltochelatase subunit CobN [Oligella urethralis]|uniref:cobaltochelatase subunit CobN n=1 Tax=Oligella urethralis TaxID=90245 RepID=UPI0009E1BEDA|nr:cobaltochelatase subunit CobN [Oligella urethralis]
MWCRVIQALCFIVCLMGAMPTAHSQPRLLVVHNDFVATQKIEVLQRFADAHEVVLQSLNINTPAARAAELIADADWIILDVPRPSDRASVARFLTAFEVQDKKQLVMGAGPAHWQHMDATLAKHLIALYTQGGAQNFQHFFELIQQQALATLEVNDLPTVQTLPESGFYHFAAATVFSDLNAYLAWHQSYLQEAGNHFQAPVVVPKGRVAFLISASVVSDLVTDIIDEIMLAAELKGIQPIVFWLANDAPAGALQALFKEAQLDALVNLTHLQNSHDLVSEFDALDIPVIQSLRFREADIRQWSKASSGVSASVAATFLALPETWGLSDPIVLAGRSQGRDVLMPKQLDALMAKLRKLIALRKTPNPQKRLALLFWNYPPGEKNLGASNLNVPRSVLSIQQALQAAAYEVGETLSEETLITELQALLSAIYRPEQLDALLAAEVPTAERLEYRHYALLPLERYMQWLQIQAPAVQTAMMRHHDLQAHWALREVDGKRYFVLPRLRLANLVLMPQMPRAGDPNAHYHDVQQIPDHLYMAAYLYLQQQYAAHALIHLGTHGTQEWLPGKDRGLAVEDYPWLALGDLPVFYPYIQDNVGEAIQAKRRGRAVMISHQTPAFAPAGLYDQLRTMHDLIHALSQLDEGMVKQQTLAQLIDLAAQHHYLEDLGWTRETAEQDSLAFSAALHDYLHEIAEAAMPLGLHTFGEPASEHERMVTLMQQLGEPFYDAMGLAAEERLVRDTETVQQHPAYLKIAAWLNGAEVPEAMSALSGFYDDALSFNQALQQNEENAALIRALAGGYVLPGNGGDPIRQPGLISGRNLYAFEATKIPTKQSYEAGELAFKQLVAAYQAAHQGALPKKLAFSLWSSEAIRHLGVTEAQLLHALGLRPVWEPSGRLERLDIIPLSELGRARVDVVVQVTGVYRDQFDHFMTLLNQAIAELATLDEDPAMNPIAANSQAVAAHLRQTAGLSLSAEAALAQAKLRIFSNDAGHYGTGVPHLALQSSQWDDAEVLAQQFMQSQSYPYRNGTGLSQLSAENAKAVLSAQLAGVDAAIMSRSSHVHGVLSTDHGFEFLGGLSAAIELINGAAPQLLVSDLRQQTPRTSSLEHFLAQELRSRYLNPQWIQAMQDEGYAGTLALLNITNNLFGWQVMNQNTVRDDQWQAMFDTYVMDRYELGLNQWFEAHNPNAEAQLLERMAEAIRHGYWEASASTKAALAERWQDLNARYEITDIAAVSQTFLAEIAAGYGLTGARPDSAAELVTEFAQPPQSEVADASQALPLEQVQGQVLEKVRVSAPEPRPVYYVLFLMLWIALGGFWQYRQQRP